MSDLEQIMADLETALRGIDGVRYYDTGDNLDPPAVLVSPPSLNWDGFCGPTSATVQVFLVVGQTDRALPQMLRYLPLVSEAVDSVTDAAVRTATPTIFSAGSSELPCYAISVELAI